MAKHSPGPWEVFQSGRDEALYVASKQGNVVAFMGPEDEDENADLIAAAPDLLSILYELESYLEDREDVVDGDYGQPAPNKEMTLLREVREAIYKATGEKV